MCQTSQARSGLTAFCCILWLSAGHASICPVNCQSVKETTQKQLICATFDISSAHLSPCASGMMTLSRHSMLLLMATATPPLQHIGLTRLQESSGRAHMTHRSLTWPQTLIQEMLHGFSINQVSLMRWLRDLKGSFMMLKSSREQWALGSAAGIGGAAAATAAHHMHPILGEMH